VGIQGPIRGNQKKRIPFRGPTRSDLPGKFLCGNLPPTLARSVIEEERQNLAASGIRRRPRTSLCACGVALELGQCFVRWRAGEGWVMLIARPHWFHVVNPSMPDLCNNADRTGPNKRSPQMPQNR